jgi:hypothetical protein
VVEPGDPLWLAEDTEAVLEYLREKALTCPGCGLPRDETMSREAEEHYRSRAFRCHACAARERETAKFVAAKGKPEGLYFTIERG